MSLGSQYSQDFNQGPLIFRGKLCIVGGRIFEAISLSTCYPLYEGALLQAHGVHYV